MPRLIFDEERPPSWCAVGELLPQQQVLRLMQHEDNRGARTTRWQ